MPRPGHPLPVTYHCATSYQSNISWNTTKINDFSQYERQADYPGQQALMVMSGFSRASTLVIAITAAFDIP
jgi:hypothetical protein